MINRYRGISIIDAWHVKREVISYLHFFILLSSEIWKPDLFQITWYAFPGTYFCRIIIYIMLFWLGFWDFFDEINWICIHIYKITFNLIYVIPKRIEFLPFHQQFTCINTVYILILNRYTLKNIFNRTQNFNSEPLGRFEHLGYHENEWTVGGGGCIMKSPECVWL